MEILSVENLCKNYEKFALKNVSFSLDQGFIMGFIGRNGAGKTTTLKSMMRLVHPNSGTVTILGKNFAEDEFYCKQKIGFVLGGVDYYPKKKLKTITNVTKRFFPEWDDEKYQSLLNRFDLDSEKRIDELSAGMRVKYSLALALSHNAELLILDEPTSGLDPVSRDDLLCLFQDLIEDGEHSILFSTHITSDLEKCADFITYIKNGEIIACTDKDTFIETYRLVQGPVEELNPNLSSKLIGVRKHKFGFEALIKTIDLPMVAGIEVSAANLEAIMVHIERE
ncbi:MAG: ABC transporter ATP-binding protein [Candidatus Izemoplasmatales bacterium]